MRRFFRSILFWIQYHIIDHIIAFFNYYVRHIYIIDNARNQAMKEYLIKILEDADYQPQTPYEQFFEQKLIECHTKVMEDIQTGKYPGIPTDIYIDYKDQRQSYAFESFRLMHKRMFIKED